MRSILATSFATLLAVSIALPAAAQPGPASTTAPAASASVAKPGAPARAGAVAQHKDKAATPTPAVPKTH